MVFFYKYGDSENCARIGFCIAFVLFFIIGCSTWFTGCDPDLAPLCPRFYVKDTQVYDYQVSERQCSYCAEYGTECYDDDGGCYETCVQYVYYDCYDSFALTKYLLKGDNETCKLQVSNDVTNSTVALMEAQSKYPIGKLITMYIQKSDLLCFTTGQGAELALVGVIFLSLAGLVLVLNWIEVNFFAGPGGLSPAEKAEEEAAAARSAEMARLEAAQELQRNKTLNNHNSESAYVPYTGYAGAASAPESISVPEPAPPPAYEMVNTNGGNSV